MPLAGPRLPLAGPGRWDRTASFGTTLRGVAGGGTRVASMLGRDPRAGVSINALVGRLSDETDGGRGEKRL